MAPALPVVTVENAGYAEGIAGSLKAGLAAVPDAADAAVVLLGDMPRVTAAHIERLIAAFNEAEDRCICVPTYRGQYGNPVLWGRWLFDDLALISGDKGGRVLFARNADILCEVAMADDGVLFDVDTPADLAALSPAAATLAG
jgi:molybdenum cofactor cytidylyltransferase